jgi:hypothetical protein
MSYIYWRYDLIDDHDPQVGQIITTGTSYETIMKKWQRILPHSATWVRLVKIQAVVNGRHVDQEYKET